MLQYLCDSCERILPHTASPIRVERLFDEVPAESADLLGDYHFCAPDCARAFFVEHFPERRPDFAAARRIVAVKRAPSLLQTPAFADAVADAASLDTLEPPDDEPAPVPVTASWDEAADLQSEYTQHDWDLINGWRPAPVKNHSLGAAAALPDVARSTTTAKEATE